MRLIETTTNDVSQFKCFRDVQHHDGSIDRKNAPMKKGIYSMHLLSGLLKASNRRYMEFVSTFDDVSAGIGNLKKVSETVVTDKRTYKGFNFFAEDDVKLLITRCQAPGLFSSACAKFIFQFSDQRASC